jgi:hypothetical protein
MKILHHPAQIKAQESQHTTVSDAFAVGITIFVVPKTGTTFWRSLHSQFANANFNYKIKNVHATILKTVYPPYKLKVVSSQDDNTPKS